MIESVHLTENALERILRRTRDVRVAVLGDACLDVYWKSDMRLSTLSRETPHHPLPVVEERFSLGGAANVVGCLTSLGATVFPVAVIGQDWRGDELRRCFRDIGVSEQFLVNAQNRVTPAFCKPIRGGISDVIYEDPRLDFENYSPISNAEENRVLSALKELEGHVDVYAVCDQQRFGTITDTIRTYLEQLGKNGRLIVADSREHIGLYRNVVIKPNELESVRVFDPTSGPSPNVSAVCYADTALRLSERTGKPAVVTLGGNGALWAENGRVFHGADTPVTPPVDIVGAGDAFMSALCCGLATGATGADAISFANKAAAVVVRKIGETGTATPVEIINRFKEVQQ